MTFCFIWTILKERNDMKKLMFESLENRALFAGITALPSGDVQIDGTAGADLIQVSATNNPDVVRVRLGGTFQNVTLLPAGKIIINGFGGNDNITTSNVSNHSAIVDAGDGDDYVSGAGADDVIFGGAGNDRINAGAGNDRIYGGAGNDIIDGGAGNDMVAGNDGNDQLQGSDGNDVVIGGDGADTISGGGGNDLVFQAYSGITSPVIGDDGSTVYNDSDDQAMAALSADWAADSVLNLVALDMALIAIDDGDVDGLYTYELAY